MICSNDFLCGLKIFLSDTWAVSRVGKASYGCTVVWVCRCRFTVSHPMSQKTIPNASVFFFYKKSVLSPCACVIFLLFLIIQEVCGTCQVCVLSRRYVLELSEPSQSVDAGLFSSQMNYLLLFNYFLSSICSILSSWMPFIFIMGFLDVPSSHCIILQDFHHLMFLPFIFHDLNLVSRLTAFSCNSLLNCLIGKKFCEHWHIWGCVHITVPEFSQVHLFFF